MRRFGRTFDLARDFKTDNEVSRSPPNLSEQDGSHESLSVYYSSPQPDQSSRLPLTSLALFESKSPFLLALFTGKPLSSRKPRTLQIGVAIFNITR